MEIQEVKTTDQVQVPQAVRIPGRTKVRVGDNVGQSKAKAAKTGILNDALASPYAGEQGTVNGGIYLDPVALLLYILNREEKVAETTQQATGDAIEGQIKGIQNMAATEAKALVNQGQTMQSKAIAGMWTSIAGIGMATLAIGGSLGGAAYFSRKLRNIDTELQGDQAALNPMRVDVENDNVQSKPLANDDNDFDSMYSVSHDSADESIASAELSEDDVVVDAAEEPKNNTQLNEQDRTRTKETVLEKRRSQKGENDRDKAKKQWDAYNNGVQGVGTLGQAGPQAANAAITAPMELEIKNAEATQTRAQATRTVIQSVFQLVQEVYSKSANRQEQFADMVAQAGQRFAAAQAA